MDKKECNETCTCHKDIQCISGNNFIFKNATNSATPTPILDAITPFTPILSVTINSEKMESPKILFKFSSILTYTMTLSSASIPGRLFIESTIRISRLIGKSLIPVSQNFSNINLINVTDQDFRRPQIDSSSFIFNFCHSPQDCSCCNITYVVEASSRFRIINSNPANIITFTGLLDNIQLLTIAYDCK